MRKYRIHRVRCIGGHCWELSGPGMAFCPHFRTFDEAVKAAGKRAR